MTPIPVNKIQLNVKTIQLAQWRKVDPADRLLDITIKSGEPLLAPTWEMLRDLRAKKITEEEYAERYINLMKARMISIPEFYRDILVTQSAAFKSVVFACYCAKGKFCHRRVLVDDIFPKAANLLGIEFVDLGEVT